MECEICSCLLEYSCNDHEEFFECTSCSAIYNIDGDLIKLFGNPVESVV